MGALGCCGGIGAGGCAFGAAIVSIRNRLQERLQAIRATTGHEELIAALSDPSPLVVEAAAKRVEQPRAAGALLRAYLRLHTGGAEGDPGCWARIALIEALARLSAPEGEDAARLAIHTVQVERVSGGLVDTATGLRVAAAGLLANLQAPGELIDLAVLLFDRERNAPCSEAEAPFAKQATRVAAARAIGALGDPGGGAVLALKLAFPEGELTEVLAECMDGLVALEERRVVELLGPWLTRPDPYLAAVAATGIARVGRGRAVETLLEALPLAVREAREPLVLAIGSIRSDEARRAVAELAEHEDLVIRKAARELL